MERLQNNKEFLIEACVGSFEEAIIAQDRGAHQIELCSALDKDGLTPFMIDIEKCLKELHIPIKVMIRPYEGSFLTQEADLSAMKREIAKVKEMSVQRIVMGLTTSEQKLDITTLSILRDLAHPMKITVHKAIDTCTDPVAEVDALLKAGGFDSILTSGGATTALKGVAVIKDMMTLTQNDLDIIAAGRITDANLHDVHKLIDSRYYHGRKIVGSLV